MSLPPLHDAGFETRQDAALFAPRFPLPPVLPDGAVGFLARRQDHSALFAFYRPDGSVAETFGPDATPATIAAAKGIVLLASAEYRAFHIWPAFPASTESLK